MPRKYVCGVYVIELSGTQKCYIGSSKNIVQRWIDHRRDLNQGKHKNRYLQSAWNKYKAHAFTFSILEECNAAVRFEREQEYLDAFHPEFNLCPQAGGGPPWDKWSEEGKENRRRAIRERVAKITHCPKGHEYTESSTGRNNKGKRFCRTCWNAYSRATIAAETDEQREERRQRVKVYYERTRTERIAAVMASSAGRKAEKRAYDQSRAALKRECDAARRMAMTTEQRAERNLRKRAWYHAHKRTVVP